MAQRVQVLVSDGGIKDSSQPCNEIYPSKHTTRNSFSVCVAQSGLLFPANYRKNAMSKTKDLRWYRIPVILKTESEPNTQHLVKKLQIL